MKLVLDSWRPQKERKSLEQVAFYSRKVDNTDKIEQRRS